MYKYAICTHYNTLYNIPHNPIFIPAPCASKQLDSHYHTHATLVLSSNTSPPRITSSILTRKVALKLSLGVTQSCTWNTEQLTLLPYLLLHYYPICTGELDSKSLTYTSSVILSFIHTQSTYILSHPIVHPHTIILTFIQLFSHYPLPYLTGSIQPAAAAATEVHINDTTSTRAFSPKSYSARGSSHRPRTSSHSFSGSSHSPGFSPSPTSLILSQFGRPQTKVER